MIVKQVLFGDEAREKLMNGIRTLSRAVKSTLGARGRTALIESENHKFGITSTKDGVTVAKSINLEDPVENMAIQTLRQAAENTATTAGDGTTTSIVLAEAIISEAELAFQDKSYNKTLVIRGIEKAAEKICQELDKMAISVDGPRLMDIATISANNDHELGEFIAKAYEHVGNDGTVTVKDGDGDTYVEFSKGIRFDRGWLSKWQLTDMKKKRIEYSGGVYVLVSDRKLESLFDLDDSLIARVVSEQKPIIFICDLDHRAIAEINQNVVEKKIKAANVLPPNFGRRKVDMMRDIANVIGATFISDETGDDWGLVGMDHLGYVDSVIIDEDSTTLINEEIFSSDDFSEYIQSLKDELEESNNDQDKTELRDRIAMLSGKAAIITVGGRTDLEQKEKRDRVDDAVLATKAALDGGVLPGGGSALLNLSWSNIDFGDMTGDVISDSVAISIVKNAIQHPFKQILINAGVDEVEVADRLFELFDNGTKYAGYDVVRNEIVDMVYSGIIDPAKVTKTALLNATSVSGTILSCETVISNVRDYGKQ